LLLHSILLLLLSLEHYNAYSRVLLLNITSSLALPSSILYGDEVRVANGLSQATKGMSNDEGTQKRLDENRSSKKWKMGIPCVPGLGPSGTAISFAAPLLAAGIANVSVGLGLGHSATVGLLGHMSESAITVGNVFGMFGARATGKTMEQYVKDIQDFAFKPLRGPLNDGETELGKVSIQTRRLRVVVGVDGWINHEDDIVKPWKVLGDQAEVYTLQWELEVVHKLRNALETATRSAAWSMAKRELLAGVGEPPSSIGGRPRGLPRVRGVSSNLPPTAFESLKQRVWPPGLVKISKIIDNPFQAGMVRGEKTGAVLADIIMNKVQGERGITLIGYSIGARLIYSCLMILSERRAFGLVENVVLMGAPVPSDTYTWCALRSVISGRLVNVYSRRDYMLGYLYRTCSAHAGVAGLRRIENVQGVENVDVSDKISNHLRYQYLVGSILKHIDWEDINKEQVETDEKATVNMEEQRRERERKRDEVELGTRPNDNERRPSKLQGHGIIQTRIRKVKGRKK
jgi:hypothetical protein